MIISEILIATVDGLDRINGYDFSAQGFALVDQLVFTVLQPFVIFTKGSEPLELFLQYSDDLVFLVEACTEVFDSDFGAEGTRIVP